MDWSHLDPAMKAALAAGGALIFLAGAGWAIYGPDIFLTVVMAGLAYCF